MKKDIKKQFNENGIDLNFRNIDLNNRDKNINLISSILIASLIYISITLNLISLFKIEGINYIPIIIGFITIIGFGYYFEFNNSFSIVSLLPCLIVLIFMFSQRNYIINGLFLIMNQIRDVVGSNTGFIMKKYNIDISEDLFRMSIIHISIIFSIIMGYVSIVSVRYNSNILIWLIIIPIYILQGFTSINSSFIYNVLLLLVTMIIASNSFVKTSNDRKKKTGDTNISLYLSLFFIVIILISSLIIISIIPIDNYDLNSNLDALESNITNKLEDFRYEKVKTNSFTQGDFSKLKELEMSERTALELKMDEPVSLYLKGYIGSKYTSKRWTDLDNETYYDSHPLFYWLNESNFTGLGQLSLVNDLVMDNDGNKEKTNINVNNISASSKYLYLPYEFDSNSSNLKNVRNLSDGKLVSKELTGSREYSYLANKNLVSKYPQLVGNLYNMKDSGELEEYIKDESYYNEFIYENYRELPIEIEDLIRDHIGKVSNINDSHIPYEIAIGEVKSYLKENINYTEDPATLPENVDFLKFFLEESREGYSTHYATAATAIFRYFKIPSRYVEGYLVTPTDVENIKEMDSISITGENAHAWTEIYIDQLGWIPIEVTPPYEDVMEAIDMTNYPGGDSLDRDKYLQSGGRFEQGMQEIVDDEEIQTSRPEEKPQKKIITLKRVLILIALFLFIIILIYLIYLIKNRKKLKKLEAGFKDSNYKLAIPRMFSYSMNLMHYDGINKKAGSIHSYKDDIEQKYSYKYMEAFERAVKINQKSIYSNYEISEEEYNYMMRFKNQILHKLVESKNIWQRIRMKLWDFIY